MEEKHARHNIGLPVVVVSALHVTRGLDQAGEQDVFYIPCITGKI